MSYDFSKVLENAKAVKEQQGSRGSGSLDLYPGDGKTVVRTLLQQREKRNAECRKH